MLRHGEKCWYDWRLTGFPKNFSEGEDVEAGEVL
jgi:hypothetical protein